MPPPAARIHHYVPEFYLAGFTLAGTREDMLWVFDRQQERRWQGRPDQVARERDFYRIDGDKPNAVEDALGEFENHAAEVLRKVQAEWTLPEGGEELGTLLGFVGFQITRVPQFREMFESTKRHLTKSRSRFVLSQPKIFEQFAEEMRRDGKELPEGITRETMLEFLEDESRYTIEIPNELTVKNMALMTGELLPILGKRAWSLFVAKDDEDDFICTDRPATLIPTAGAPPFFGFGTKETEIIMPLSRKLALVGNWDDEGQVFQADHGIVGLINQLMLDHAHRFVFSAREGFVVSTLRPAKDDNGGSAETLP